MPLDSVIKILKEEHVAASLCEVANDSTCRTCLGDLQQVRPNDATHILQECQHEFGLRLLLAIIYVARREATEGQIWPAVRTGLSLAAPVEDILFQSNGQPRSEVKMLIEKTCRHYRLRHIFGQDGTQEWFGSIYLQFGFTQRGFTKMLPEWLMGYNQPNTIARLLDDSELKSESFRKLWEAFLSFRRGNASEVLTRRIISENPWVLPDWTDELLLAARKRPHLSPATYRSASSEAGKGPRSFLSEPRLMVGDLLAEARWRIELTGLAEWEHTGSSFCVRLRCGELAVQEVFLRKQADGSLSNLTHTFEFPLALVNESQVSASITDQQGREVAAQDIRLFDPDADIMAFSERGYLDDGFVKRGPRQNALYYVLVRTDMNFIPQPAEWHRFEGMGYRLNRLHLKAGQQLRVLFEDGDELWSNITCLRDSTALLPTSVRPICQLATENSQRAYDPKTMDLILEIAGLSGATLVAARWRSHKLTVFGSNSFEGSGDSWQAMMSSIAQAFENGGQIPSVKVPKVDALLARRLVMHMTLKYNDCIFRTSVEFVLALPGILEQSRGRVAFGEFFATRNNEQLKRGRYTIMPKALAFEQQERGLRWCLFEGDRFVSELREGIPPPFYDLGAYGQSVSIRTGQFNREDEPTVLIGEVADKGLFHIYDVNPFIGQDYTFEAWASPEMGAEHKLFFGLMHEKATQEPADERLVFDDDKAMFAPFPAQPCDYLVLVYSGVRLATWWRVPQDGSSWSTNLAEIRDDVDARRAAFTIRWAKLPVLSGHHYHHVKEFFHRFPHIVLGEWLCGCKERKDGRRIESENTEAWHDAVRAIIQGYQIEHEELTTETKQKLIQCLPSQPTEDVNAKALDTFQAVGACDPVLMGRMICFWRTTNAAQSNMRNMGSMLLFKHPPEGGLREALRIATPDTDEVFLDRLLEIGTRAVTNPSLEPSESNNLKSALTLGAFRRMLYRRIVIQFLPPHNHR